jgi:hypothetical protein
MLKRLVVVSNPINRHHLVPSWINDLDRHPAMLAGGKGRLLVLAKVSHTLSSTVRPSALANLLPGALVREKGLADVEGASVVVGI